MKERRLYIHGRPSTSDSAPVRGDGYEPGSLKFRLRANAETLYSSAIGPGGGFERWGGGEKFSDGEILKNTTVGSLHTTTTTLFSYPGHLYDPTWMHSI